MARLAVISTPNAGAPDGTPRRIVADLPAVDIEVVQFKRNGPVAVPYFWMQGVPATEFESVLGNDRRITDLQRLERTDAGALYRAEWEVDAPIIHCVASTNGVVVRAHGTVEEWRLRIWFEDGTDTSTFQECCASRDVPLEVHRLKSLTDVLSDGHTNLSQAQHEVMVLAYREGYFEEPRRVSQRELADELDISSTAVGRRLRRGFNSLLEETIIDASDEGGDAE